MAKDNRRSTFFLLYLVHDSGRIGDWPSVEFQAVHLVVVVYMGFYCSGRAPTESRSQLE
jgi:hypothetical protein